MLSLGSRGGLYSRGKGKYRGSAINGVARTRVEATSSEGGGAGFGSWSTVHFRRLMAGRGSRARTRAFNGVRPCERGQGEGSIY